MRNHPPVRLDSSCAKRSSGPHRARFTITSAAVIVAGALALGACGSSKPASSSATSPATSTGSSVTSTATAVTGAPIHIMQIADITGPSPYPAMGPAAQATVKAFNASGGISGHPVDLTVCDAQSDPNRAEACARQAVSAHDVAVVGGFTLGVAGVMPVLIAAKIPYIPADAFAPAELTAINSFPVDDALSTVAGAGYIAGKSCASSVITTESGPEDQIDESLINSELKAAGKPAAKTILLSFTPGDYSNQASQVVDSKAACMLSINNPPNALAFYPALKAAGFTKRIVGVAGESVTPQVVAKVGSYLNGTQLADYYPAYASAPWSAFRAAVAKYSNPTKYDFSVTFTEGAYVALLLFKDAAGKVIANNQTVTATTLQSALSGETNFTGGGLSPGLDFSKPSAIKGLPRLFNPNIWLEKVAAAKIVNDGAGFHSVAPAFAATAG